MITVKQILEKLKSRKKFYQEVIAPDKFGNLTYVFLRYNKVRRKFYIENELDSVHRKTIGRREAEIYIAKTLTYLSKVENINSIKIVE